MAVISSLENLTELCKRAKDSSRILAPLETQKKNEAIIAAADSLIKNTEKIIEANKRDLDRAKEKNMPLPLQDRLMLDKDRIKAMADGLREIAALSDPIGSESGAWKRPNGLLIRKRVVPLGVVGVIYEARPNVTSDVFGLCFKTGNACILKGGSAAHDSNLSVVSAIKEAVSDCGIDSDVISYIDSSDREISKQFMKMNEYVDVLIPRGGAGLINSVIENATIPVIETGTGNCHIYVDSSADFDMALKIIVNAKTQRVGVCNAAESLLVNRSIAKDFLPEVYKALNGKNVELRTDKDSHDIIPDTMPATEEDWGTEYLDYKMSVKLVDSVEEAVDHINKYNTGHSETIVTKDYDNATYFQDRVDAACVYVNASTRFTDGNQFGFGAEIGISTQKLHARGPMGLEALCTSKYVINGNGQIRE